ncbi:MAG TPA: hypothetical protein VLE97_07910 [Gaiellaceae bacterium]|nr:hypothetical protein [Gaiellaceae bacterium]
MPTDELWFSTEPPPYNWQLDDWSEAEETSYLRELWLDLLAGAREALRFLALVAGFLLALVVSCALFVLAAQLMS